MPTTSHLPFATKDLNSLTASTKMKKTVTKRKVVTSIGDFLEAWNKRDMKVVEAVLAGGVDKKDSKGRTLLYHAVDKGHGDLVKLLVKKGADPSRAWYLAAKRGDASIVMSLYLSSATTMDVNQRESGGQTALHAASANGHAEVVKLLVEEIDGDVSCVCEQGYTPLLLAAGKGHNGVGKLLLKHGADPNQAGKETPLFMASKRGYETMVSVLISHGAHVDCCSTGGIAPLQVAVSKRHFKVAITLIKAHSDAKLGEALVRMDVDLVTTLLCITVEKRNHSILKRLLQAGAKPNGVDKSKRSALHYACRKGIKSLVTLLVEYGANATGLLDESGKSAKDYAQDAPGLEGFFDTPPAVDDDDRLVGLMSKLQALKVE